MARTTIPWGDGSGDNIYLDYSAASGDQTVAVYSDANNGNERTKTITFTASGASPSVLTIVQAGESLERRELVAGSIADRLLSSYDTEDNSFAAISNVNNAYTSSESSYCQINLAEGSEATSYIYWKWNVSDIPADAEITSVSAVARVYISNINSANIAQRFVTLCKDKVIVGTNRLMTTTPANRDVSGGTFTMAELDTISLLMQAKRTEGGPTTGYNMRIYYGKLSVSYNYYKYYYTVKVVNNVAGLTVTGGQEYEKGDTVTLTFSGLASGFTVSDNGVDVTSQLVEVDLTTFTLSIPSINEGHRIVCLQA